MLCRHWSTNRSGLCRAPGCHQTPDTLEHLLAVCPALDTVRERLYTMWLERSVMYPTLHSTIREVLDSAEAIKVQFILEPLAFPQLASLARLHGQRFVEQVSYLTRTFAFYIHREHQNIIKVVNNSNPLCPAIPNSITNICTNSSIFSADPDIHHSSNISTLPIR